MNDCNTLESKNTIVRKYRFSDTHNITEHESYINTQSTNFANKTSQAGLFIPYFSNNKIILTVSNLGKPLTCAYVGFGKSKSGNNVTNKAIDLSSNLNIANSFAYIVPKSGFITSISSCFTFSKALDLTNTNLEIKTQLYAANLPNNFFSPLSDAKVLLTPCFNSIINKGTVIFGQIENLSIKVNANTRLFLVTTANIKNGSFCDIIEGYLNSTVLFL